MSPGQEAEAKPANKDGGFNFGSVEERMFISQYIGGGAALGESKAIGQGAPAFFEN
jgi:hypothetical protein